MSYELGDPTPLFTGEDVDPARPGHHRHRHARKGIALRVRLRPLARTPRHVLRKTLYLPVVIGEEWLLSQASGHTDFTTIGGGEFAHRQAGKHAHMLRTFSIDTAAMTWDPAWITYPGQDPEDIRKGLYRILRDEGAVHMLAILGGTGRRRIRAEFDGRVTLRNIDERLRHGEPDTRYYDLDFREDRRLNIDRRGHGGHGHGRHKLPLMHKLKGGDTLRSLAKRYYHDGSEWRHIRGANGIKHWGSEDPLLRMQRYKPGDKIKIPRKPDKPHGPGSGGTSASEPERALYITEDE